jgi:hypothetical protein
VGGSGYFDGTRDYLTLPSTSNLSFGTGDFSIEAWVYPTSVVEESIIANTTTSGAGDTQLVFYIFNNKLNIGGWFTNFLTGSTNVSVNAWSHVVVCRTGTTMSLFLNGARDATGTVSNNFSSTNAFFVGAYPSGTGGDFNGYITNLRVLKGSSAYDPTQTSITIPTAPLTAITNTSLLLNFTNAGITDATAKNDLETVGNAQISTTQSKWGGGSMYFDGTGDYLYKPYDPLLNQVNGNFTIECWIYPTATSTRMIFAGLASATGDTNWTWEITSGNKLAFVWTNTTPTVFTATSTASISPNTWTYIAVVKNGGTITQYINGSADGTSSPTGTYRNGSYGFGIGRAGDYNGLYFTGYIDDFRMTIGQARTITASPSAPFPVQ